jgi:hypothetical protein
MQQRRRLRTLSAWALVLVLPAGCYQERKAIKPVAQQPQSQPGPQTVKVERPGPAAPTPIEVTPIQIGAEGRIEPMGPFQQPEPARRFSFLVTGFGVEPPGGNPVDRKAAAIEAAIVDALGQAVREAQRDPKTGRAPIEYKMDLGPGLTIYGQLVGGAPQTVIVLDRRGRTYEFCSRSGVLAHPPYDARVVQQVFAATQGRFVLQATRATEEPGRYSADVGYYQKVGPATNSQPASRQTERPIIATVK